MKHFVDPDKERFSQFKDLPLNEPVQMLNLVALHETSIYEDGTTISGEAAYEAYGKESGPIFRRLGGKIIWAGMFELTLIGPVDEKWDVVFIAEYPTGQAFVDMVRDPDYRKAVRHRQAAVKTSRLIRLAKRPIGQTFG